MIETLLKIKQITERIDRESQVLELIDRDNPAAIELGALINNLAILVQTI